MHENTDTDRLNWMIFCSASIHHSRDGDNCWVKWPDEEDDYHCTKVMSDSRECIDEAMRMSSKSA